PIDRAAILHLVHVRKVGAQVEPACGRKRRRSGLNGGREGCEQTDEIFHSATILTRPPDNPSLATETSIGPRPTRTIAWTRPLNALRCAARSGSRLLGLPLPTPITSPLVALKRSKLSAVGTARPRASTTAAFAMTTSPAFASRRSTVSRKACAGPVVSRTSRAT